MFLLFVPLLGNFFPCVGTFVPASGTFPVALFRYVIWACRAPRGAVGPSFFLLFACFGCKNTLNSVVFVMKRENLALSRKKVL